MLDTDAWDGRTAISSSLCNNPAGTQHDFLFYWSYCPGGEDNMGEWYCSEEEDGKCYSMTRDCLSK